MRRLPASLLVLALLATVVALGNAVIAPQAHADACGPGNAAVRVDEAGVLCTHGDDTPPAGVVTTELPTTADLLRARFGSADPAAAVAEAAGDPAVASAGGVACIDDGVSGARVQLIYAHASDVAGRYASVLPLIRQTAADTDDIINASAGRVGAGRRVRYVTTAACQPDVVNVTLSPTGDDTFGNMVSELRARGFTSNDRKYLVFADAAVGICGLGEIYLNDRPDELNPNNSGRPMYSRVDTPCWQYAAAHELIHTLGGVQRSAPHATAGGHCTDEIDVMCYRDSATTVMQKTCTRAGQVDCNNDDYFHPNPAAGSYLDTKWNTARSRYLASTAPPPPAPAPKVTVPASGVAGLAWPVRVDTTASATVVWTSTRPECRFANPTALTTTWSCPATATGAGEITVHVTNDGITIPHSTTVALVAPSAPTAASVTLTTSASGITSGDLLTLQAKVIDPTTGAAVHGVPVSFWSRTDGASSWQPVATGVTTAAGAAAVTHKPTRNTTYLVRSEAVSAWTISSSNEVAVAVRTKVTGRLAKAVVAPNTSATITGTVSPDKAGQSVRLQRYRGGEWRTIAQTVVRADSEYAFAYEAARPAVIQLRVVKAADIDNIRGRTAAMELSVA